MNQRLGSVQACGDCHLMNFGNSLHRNRTSCSTSMISTRLTGRRFHGRSKAPSSERRSCRFGNRPFKKAGTGDRGDYCRSLSHPSRGLEQLSPLEIWHSRVSGAALKSPWKLLLERSLFLLSLRLQRQRRGRGRDGQSSFSTASLT